MEFSGFQITQNSFEKVALVLASFTLQLIIQSQLIGKGKQVFARHFLEYDLVWSILSF